MEKKTPKFNIIDVMAVALIVLLAVVVLWKVVGPAILPTPAEGSSSSSSSEAEEDDVHITYIVIS